MRKLPAVAKRRLTEIMGAPLLIPSETKGGDLVTIYPRCDNQALMRFLRNWKVSRREAITQIEGGTP